MVWSGNESIRKGELMYAERLILATDMSGNLKKIPKLPPNKQVEAIFLVVSDAALTPSGRRIPHPRIAGKVLFKGDIMESTPSSCWGLHT